MGRAPAGLATLLALAVPFIGCGTTGAGTSAASNTLDSSADAIGPSSGDGAVFNGDGPSADTVADVALGGSVSGRVVDATTSRPLAGRTVVIGHQRATTDVDGKFSLDGADPIYDVTVVDPDGTTISVYQSVSRRDPVLVHHPSATPDPTANAAGVSGALSGGVPYPLGPSNTVVVHFFSEQASNSTLLSGNLAADSRGPSYGPIALLWNGPASVAGQLVALGWFTGADDAGVSIEFFHQALTVSRGQTATADLPLAPIGLGHVAGIIQTPTGISVGYRQVLHRLPMLQANVTLVNEEQSSPSFDFTIPDLSDLGGEVCVRAGGGPGLVLTERCAIPLGATGISISLQAPPSLTAPIAGAAVTKGARLAWTAFDSGVYDLDLEPVVPTRLVPSIHVFTSATSVAWPDLGSVGVAFPSAADYGCAIAGIGPFVTIDDALAPDGLAAPIHRELRKSIGAEVRVTTR